MPILPPMPKFPSDAVRAARCVFAAALLGTAAHAAIANPDFRPLPPAAAAASAADAVSRFLIDKGLIGASPIVGVPGGPEAGFVAQVRDKASDMVLTAMNFLGVRYRRGGSSADNGFDCSGFTRHLFGQALGIELPRRVDDQAHDRSLSQVSRDALRAGDLVFFNTLRRTFSHVGIYVGDGRFIHAPRSGAQIRLERLSASYWSRRFTGARRAAVLDDETTR